MRAIKYKGAHEKDNINKVDKVDVLDKVGELNEATNADDLGRRLSRRGRG